MISNKITKLVMFFMLFLSVASLSIADANEEALLNYNLMEYQASSDFLMNQVNNLIGLPEQNLATLINIETAIMAGISNLENYQEQAQNR